MKTLKTMKSPPTVSPVVSPVAATATRPMGSLDSTVLKRTYRQWVEAGARGYFLAPGVAVNAIRLISPSDSRGGYFVRRDTSDPIQRQRRA
ncbi:MAG TPA: hypothetical protein VIC27_05020, partial [Ktedonobacterales bacterium]